MDAKQIYVKTVIGDEAVRQSTRVVQRNLRMVLVQVDGKLSVAELSAKIGNPRLVEAALRDLEEGGFIAPRQGLVLGRTEEPAAEPNAPAATAATSAPPASQFPASQFSSFGKAALANPSQMPINSQFSSFGKPILPAAGYQAPPPPTVSVKKHERKPRPAKQDEPEKPLAIGRWLIGAPLGLLLLALLVVLLYPYNNAKPEIEAAAAQLLQMPVKIGSVGISFLPRPAVTLSDVKLGDAEQGSIEVVRISSPLALLGSGPRQLPVVDVNGAKLSADFVADNALLRKGASDSGVRIQQMNFEHLTVTVRDLAVRNLAGKLVFLADGGAEKAELRNDDEGIRLQAAPVADGIALDIQGAGWMPLGKALAFNSLQAKGVLQKGKLVIQSMDTTFLNGILKGSWLLDWSKGGLSMAGDGSLQRIDCRKMTAALAPSLNLEGELGGGLRLRGSGLDWNGLWSNVEAHLDADIAKGIVHGTDLGDAVRGGNGFVGRAGATKFDRLRVALNINSREVVGKDIQMAAGMMNVTGQFVAGRQRPVDANLFVTMQTSVSTVRSPVRVSGELPNLQTVSGK